MLLPASQPLARGCVGRRRSCERSAASAAVECSRSALFAAPRRATQRSSLALPSVRRRGFVAAAAAAEEQPEGVPAEIDDDQPWVSEIEGATLPSFGGVDADEGEDKLPPRRLNAALRLAVACSYAAAVLVLLTFVPDLPHVLQATPAQMQLFALALLVTERGTAVYAALDSCQIGLRRARLEQRIYTELAAGGRSEAVALGVAAVTSEARCRAYLLRIAVAVPLELAGAIMAALAPTAAPGVALLCLASLPMRSFGWYCNEHGVVEEAKKDIRDQQLAADAMLFLAALAQGALRGAWAGAVAALTVALVLRQIHLARDLRAEAPVPPLLSAV